MKRDNGILQIRIFIYIYFLFDMDFSPAVEENTCSWRILFNKLACINTCTYLLTNENSMFLSHFIGLIYIYEKILCQCLKSIL